ncbi:MAG: FAD:protein FMN transferase [Eubacteriales bacterium]|nr:FAD:protein FMN transferase [Eubacteriales bacterium]
MKRLICGLLLLSFFLSGCAGQGRAEQKRYEATFLTLFDTVTTIKGAAESQEAFTATAQAIHDELLHYHRLFDIYNDYEGLNNLKTVNDNAGIAPVTVDRAVLDLLLDCKDYFELTDGRVNVAMGSVLYLWHRARTDSLDDPANAYLPDPAALEEASAHVSPDAVVIDEAASTVFITDPAVRLDVGAVAKGWSAQRVSENAPKGLLISVGGNVCATGPKDESGTPWVIGVQNPADSSTNLHTLYISGGSVVTSGDYQRAFRVGGRLYHHIIDPDTLYPSAYWRSVTIVCPDSGLADALSTALFLLPREEGQALLDKTQAQAMWVDAEGTCFYSPGFEKLIRT